MMNNLVTLNFIRIHFEEFEFYCCPRCKAIYSKALFGEGELKVCSHCFLGIQILGASITLTDNIVLPSKEEFIENVKVTQQYIDGLERVNVFDGKLIICPMGVGEIVAIYGDYVLVKLYQPTFTRHLFCFNRLTDRIELLAATKLVYDIYG